MTQEQIVAALVNPLAWIPYETDDGTRGVHADATFGKYLCVPSGWFLVGQTGWMDETDLEAAKAAAQADYEARILAAIEAVPAAHVWAEAIEVAAQIAEDWFYDPENDVVTDRRLAEAVRALKQKEPKE